MLAEKIRQGVAERALGGPEVELRTSLSIGVVAYPHDGTTVDELMITADQAMYSSKRQGKNRVAGYVPDARDAGAGDRETNLVGDPVMADGPDSEPVGVMAGHEDDRPDN